MNSIRTHLWHTMVFSLVLFCFAAPVHAADQDNDGLTDAEEIAFYTDIHNPDTDGDGYLDGQEVHNGYSPHAGDGLRMHMHDYDNDGLNDWQERWFGGDIGNADTDGDGEKDGDEVRYGKSPTGNDELSFDRSLVVDRTLQRLYFYVDGVKLDNYPVSTGNPESETPVGKFDIQRKVDEKSYIGPGYNLPGVKWNLQFKPMYYIHSAYWHNDFGLRTHSHGCVNMRESDAKELYSYIPVGMPVEVIGDTPKAYKVGT